MVEYKYYSVNIEVDESDESIRVEGLRLFGKFTELGFDLTEFGGVDSREWRVDKSEVEHIINTEWVMKKDDKFIKNLCNKLSKIVTEYMRKGISLEY